MASRVCRIEGCGRKHEARGWCRTHYVRWKTHGDPHKLAYDRCGNGLSGTAHPLWVGDAVGYGTMHERLKRTRGRAADHACYDCGAPAADWSYDHSDPSEKTELRDGYQLAYSTDMSRYVPRCKSCHKLHDLAHGREVSCG